LAKRKETWKAARCPKNTKGKIQLRRNNLGDTTDCEGNLFWKIVQIRTLPVFDIYARPPEKAKWRGPYGLNLRMRFIICAPEAMRSERFSWTSRIEVG